MEPVQVFKYSGINAEGAVQLSEGRKSFHLALTNNVNSAVETLVKGAHNTLHRHLAEDGHWIVLAGRARFHGPGEEIIAELGKFEGVLLPRGTGYWYESLDDEPLEILRVNYRVREGPRRKEHAGPGAAQLEPESAAATA